MLAAAAVCRCNCPFTAAHSKGGFAPTSSQFTGQLLGAELQPTLTLGPSRAPHVLNDVFLPSTKCPVHLPGWPSSRTRAGPPLATSLSRALGQLPPVVPSNSDARNSPSIMLRLPLAAVAGPFSGHQNSICQALPAILGITSHCRHPSPADCPPTP